MTERAADPAPAPADDSAATPQATAVRHLTEHGYDRTTTAELADAIGMSRSTFFRRFGSKDDVIFADHDLALAQLEQHLRDTDLPPGEALTAGVLGVFRVLTQDPRTARSRFELLRATPALRDRELVISHRYERVFAGYLARVQGPDAPEWPAISLAAAAVALHNATLRRWLRSDHRDARLGLESELRHLIGRFGPWLGDEHRRSRVLVAAFAEDTSPEEVLSALTERLRYPPNET